MSEALLSMDGALLRAVRIVLLVFLSFKFFFFFSLAQCQEVPIETGGQGTSQPTGP